MAKTKAELLELVERLRRDNPPEVSGFYAVPKPLLIRLLEHESAERDRVARQRAIVNTLRARWQEAYRHQHDPRQFQLAARLAKRIRRLTYAWGV